MKSKHKSNKFSEINMTLDKMIEYEKSKTKVSWYKIIILITGCIAGLMIIGSLCIIFYKNSFSLESLLSLLLAFFSIFISIFFYFKTEETSNHFYDMSYDFMKDVSVTLGKIEERFGEKLNNINDKVSHLTQAKEEKTEELQIVEDEKQKVINELIDKAKLDESQKEEYLRRWKENEKEAEELRKQLDFIDMKYRNMLAHGRVDNKVNMRKSILEIFSDDEIHLLSNRHITDLPKSIMKKLEDYYFIDYNGELTPKGEMLYRILST